MDRLSLGNAIGPGGGATAHDRVGLRGGGFGQGFGQGMAHLDADGNEVAQVSHAAVVRQAADDRHPPDDPVRHRSVERRKLPERGNRLGQQTGQRQKGDEWSRTESQQRPLIGKETQQELPGWGQFQVEVTEDS